MWRRNDRSPADPGGSIAKQWQNDGKTAAKTQQRICDSLSHLPAAGGHLTEFDRSLT
jgi:hypothetical protein